MDRIAKSVADIGLAASTFFLAAAVSVPAHAAAPMSCDSLAEKP